MGEQDDVATLGAALGEFDVATSGLRGHVWRALARPGMTGAAEAARAASADAADLARDRLGRGDPAGALRALETARGLALFAATEVRPVTDHLAAAGKPDLARQWRAAAGVAGPQHLPADLRRDVLATLLSRSAAAALLTPPSVAEIQSALAAVDADVLVHLIPGHAVLTPVTGPVTHLPLPTLTAGAEHIERFLATLALHNAAASTTDPSSPNPVPVAPDLVAPDLVAPVPVALDLAAPDLAALDLAALDLAAPDLAAPDLAAPDLVAPDLVADAETAADLPAADGPTSDASGTRSLGEEPIDDTGDKSGFDKSARDDATRPAGRSGWTARDAGGEKVEDVAEDVAGRRFGDVGGWPVDRPRPQIVRPWFLTDQQGPAGNRPWPVVSYPGPGGAGQRPPVVLPAPGPAVPPRERVAQQPAVAGPASPPQEPAGERPVGRVPATAVPPPVDEPPSVDLTNSLQALGRWSWDAVVGPLLEHLAANRIAGRPEGRRFPGPAPMPIPALGATGDSPAAAGDPRPPRIILVAGGDLARVPWSAARRGDGTYALELLAISQAASARLLVHNAARPSLPQSAAGLVVADPDTGGHARELPAARLEAYAIQQALYPQARLTGRRPDGTASPSGAGTLAQVRAWLATSNPGAGSTLHLACTGFTRAGADRPAAYALMAGGERLTATDVLARTGRRRPIDLVVLAAGRTGLSLAGYDEAFGLGTAFLAGDVRSVLSTRWTVPDAAAPALLFMTHLFRRRGRTVWAALRAAQLWMLDGQRVVPPEMPPELVAAVNRADPSAVIAWAAVTHWGR